MKTRDLTMISGFLAVMAFLWSISADIADVREQIGANTAATAANTAAIADMRAAVSANSAAIAELRADISELRGALLAHIGGHSHSEKVAVAETGAK